MKEKNNFKAGDIVICRSSALNLTYDYEYKISRVEGDKVWVINDSNYEDWFAFTRFKLKKAESLFKKGDIVICIDNKNKEATLTQEKEYGLTEVYENGGRVQVINDLGVHMKCFSTRFAPNTITSKITTMFKPYT